MITMITLNGLPWNKCSSFFASFMPTYCSTCYFNKICYINERLFSFFLYLYNWWSLQYFYIAMQSLEKSCLRVIWPILFIQKRNMTYLTILFSLVNYVVLANLISLQKKIKNLASLLRWILLYFSAKRLLSTSNTVLSSTEIRNWTLKVNRRHSSCQIRW